MKKTNHAPRTEPLNHDDYLKQREVLWLSYKESIKEYDRLVTWASAGALGVSITFLDKFGQNADAQTAWLLGGGWLLLGAAFATSLSSQYASSRVHSWKRRELDYLQMAPADRPDTWAARAVELDRVAGRYGAATRRLTFISGILLLGGIVSIATFAFLNAPFKPAEALADRPAVTPKVIVPEKKGTEYLPEPVPRPKPATPATPPPPIEKR